MQHRFLKCSSSVFVVAAIGTVMWVNAGDLNPPVGTIAPTMKTLSEVEPRVPISTANTPGDMDSLYRITQPGSYYLTGNTTGAGGVYGIEIASSGVTIDLRGFELVGVPGSLAGITNGAFGLRNVTIRNGTVRDWGQQGLTIFATSNVVFENLIAADNGTDGFTVGDGPLMTRCSAYSNGGDGFDVGPGATITSCTAKENTSIGFRISSGSTLAHCTASTNTGDGFQVSGGSTVTACAALSNGGDGFATGNSTIVNCTAAANTGDGIQVDNDAHVTGNTFIGNGNNGDGAGIHVTMSDNRIEGNSVNDNDRGIDVDSAGNLIIRNSASGNTTNYDIVAGNANAQVLAPGAGFVSTDPWANFSY